MKNLKVQFAALALVLGFGSAMATTKAFTLNRWIKDASTGVYTDISNLREGEDYQCNLSQNECTEDFPAGVNPNDQDHDSYPGTAQATVNPGDFVQ